MVNGSCLCGEFKIQYDGPPTKIVCHCLPCRKSSGTPASFNLIVPGSSFKMLSGTNKQWKRKGDSGKNVTYNNCANCCTLMFVEAEAMGDSKIVKLGVLDDNAVVEKGDFSAEIYMEHTLPWWKTVDGAAQKEGQ